jgi:hypothetical protein
MVLAGIFSTPGSKRFGPVVVSCWDCVFRQARWKRGGVGVVVQAQQKMVYKGRETTFEVKQ